MDAKYPTAEVKTCPWCGEDRRTSDSCSANSETEFPDGMTLASMPFDEPGSCPDCNVESGGKHHFGCSEERCSGMADFPPPIILTTLAQGSRIRLLWKKPADSGLPGSWRKVSPSMRNLYSCDPGSSAIVVE
jgi:hypothetical protein